jgi:heterodisulfide reductase subunit C
MAQIIFAILTLTAFGLFFKKASKIRRNIMLGKSEEINGNIGERVKNVLLVAFGQKKMFKRWLPATLHFTIYAAFLITQIELIEIFIDGFTGNHRIIWQVIAGTFLGSIYTFIVSFIEILSVLAFVATFAFLARRNLLKIPRFHKPEMNGWPKLDGNIILYLEIALITFIFMMNSGDLALQGIDEHYYQTDKFTISQFIAPLWSGLDTSTIFMIERIGWWGHILTVFVFLNYLPYSKHLHIMLAFPNVYFANVRPKGEMEHSEKVAEQIRELFSESESESEKFSSEVESIDDIFGDSGSSKNLDTKETKISTEESLDDIFGDTGKSEESESLDDIFGDTGKSEESESLDDIFGDTGNSKVEEESIDDIFGNDDSKSENVDDIFGDNQAETKEEAIDDLFANDKVEQAIISNQYPVTEPEEEEMPKFGASDVMDLSWKHVLGAYSCTECGRCTSVCPANITGKKLSPRKIMMDVRDRTEEIGNTLDANPKMTKKNYDDGKNLFSYITEEELHACTTCNACVEACPIMISPLDIIVEMRRNLVLDDAKAPESWNVMFTNIENNGAPWQFSNNDRDKWINE